MFVSVTSMRKRVSISVRISVSENSVVRMQSTAAPQQGLSKRMSISVRVSVRYEH